MWAQLKARIDELGWSVNTNESELKVTRANGATIELKSAEKPGRLRGRGIDYIAMDEYAEYRTNEIWTQVVRPALSDKRGQCDFTMTPKGFNHGYDLFNHAKTDSDWSAHHFKTIDSPFFQTEAGLKELEDARANLSERDFRQEYEASFENFSGRIYSSFDRARNNTDYSYDSSLPVIVGMDFNRSPMTAALFQRKEQLNQFGEIFLQAADTPEICRAIKAKFPNSVIIVRPDATGSRSYTVGKHLSDHTILREFGFRVEAAASNPARIDRWASCNRAFEQDLVRVNVKACPYTVRDLEIISYKEGSCEPMLNDPMMGHISDAHGYAVYKEFPILGKVTVSRYA